MTRNFSPCGAVCQECEKYPNVCAGCSEIKGKVWWTQYDKQKVCPFYACCVEDKGLVHCGKCDAFPCPKFTDGDPGMSEDEHKTMLETQIATLKPED